MEEDNGGNYGPSRYNHHWIESAVAYSPKLVLDMGVIILPHREACKLTNLIMSSFLLFWSHCGGLWDLSCPMRLNLDEAVKMLS